MYNTVRHSHYWPNMANDVYETVARCVSDDQTGSQYRHKRPQNLVRASGPRDAVELDGLVSLPST